MFRIRTITILSVFAFMVVSLGPILAQDTITEANKALLTC